MPARAGLPGADAGTVDRCRGEVKTWVVADSETTPRTGYAPVNGLQMYYEIHGGLAATRQVIAADFQGHGRTGDIDRPLTSADLASDVVGLLGRLDIAQADVFGNSVGGAVALHLAIRHPRLVR